LSNNNSSLERSIAPTLLGVVGAFGIAPHASNTLPNSFVLMYSPHVYRNTHLLRGSLCNITFHHGLKESLELKTCWTCDGKTNGSLPFTNICQKLAIKNSASYCL
jgi:hypothetical protein